MYLKVLAGGNRIELKLSETMSKPIRSNYKAAKNEASGQFEPVAQLCHQRTSSFRLFLRSHSVSASSQSWFPHGGMAVHGNLSFGGYC